MVPEHRTHFYARLAYLTNTLEAARTIASNASYRWESVFGGN